MNRTFINFSLIALFVLTAAVSCKPTPAAETAETILKTNQALFQGVIAEIYKRNANFTPPGSDAVELNVFDFDHTLANTETLIPISDASGKIIARRDPKCFFVEKGEKADFSVFTRPQLMGSQGVAQALKRAREYNRKKGSLVFVVTARSRPHTFQSARTFLAGKGVRVNGVIAVHSPLLMNNLWKKLKLPGGMKKPPRGMKKPLLIAALLEFARGKGAKIGMVRYFEDTDKYIGAYMQFMPSVYPNVSAQVFDYLRVGKPNKRIYTEKLIANMKDGKVTGPDGKAVVKPESYDSRDCPLD